MLLGRSGRDVRFAKLLGQWIREQRQEVLGIKQDALAEFLDVTRTTVNKWESGRANIPILKAVAVYHLVKLAREGVRDRAELRERLGEFMDSIATGKSRRDRRAGQMLRVLVVEDHPGVGDVLAEFLGFMGHKATVKSSAQDALSFLKSAERPDLLITDTRMPGGNVGILRFARELQPPIPAMVCSATWRASEKTRIRELGVKAILDKPFRLADLEAAIQTTLTGDT